MEASEWGPQTSSRRRGISRLGQVQVRAHDVERAAAFHQNVLGLKLLFKAPPGLAFFDCGGVRLMIDHPEKPEFDHPSSILYFAVPDIQAAHAQMKQSGVLLRTNRTCSPECRTTICG